MLASVVVLQTFDRIDDLHKLEVLVANDPGRVPAVEQWISQWRDQAHLGLGCPK